MILVAVAVGIFHGGVSLADASQAADGLRLCQGCGFGRGQVDVEPVEQVFASGEEGIAAKGDVPHGLRRFCLLLCGC